MMRVGRIAVRSALISIALLSAVMAMVLWRSSRSADELPVASPLPVAAITVQSRPVSAFLDAVGTLEAVRTVVLAPEAPGRITAIRFEAGNASMQVRRSCSCTTHRSWRIARPLPPRLNSHDCSLRARLICFRRELNRGLNSTSDARSGTRLLRW